MKENLNYKEFIERYNALAEASAALRGTEAAFTIGDILQELVEKYPNYNWKRLHGRFNFLK